MKITINAVHFKADKKLEDFITQKLEKIGAKNADIILKHTVQSLS